MDDGGGRHVCRPAWCARLFLRGDGGAELGTDRGGYFVCCPACCRGFLRPLPPSRSFATTQGWCWMARTFLWSPACAHSRMPAFASTSAPALCAAYLLGCLPSCLCGLPFPLSKRTPAFVLYSFACLRACVFHRQKEGCWGEQLRGAVGVLPAQLSQVCSPCRACCTSTQPPRCSGVTRISCHLCVRVSLT
jgi:hypothetical protein